jgi:hypothetical protein
VGDKEDSVSIFCNLEMLTHSYTPSRAIDTQGREATRSEYSNYSFYFPLHDPMRSWFLACHTPVVTKFGQVHTPPLINGSQNGAGSGLGRIDIWMARNE